MTSIFNINHQLVENFKQKNSYNYDKDELNLNSPSTPNTKKLRKMYLKSVQKYKKVNNLQGKCKNFLNNQIKILIKKNKQVINKEDNKKVKKITGKNKIKKIEHFSNNNETYNLYSIFFILILLGIIFSVY